MCFFFHVSSLASVFCSSSSSQMISRRFHNVKSCAINSPHHEAMTAGSSEITGMYFAAVNSYLSGILLVTIKLSRSTRKTAIVGALSLLRTTVSANDQQPRLVHYTVLQYASETNKPCIAAVTRALLLAMLHFRVEDINAILLRSLSSSFRAEAARTFEPVSDFKAELRACKHAVTARVCVTTSLQISDVDVYSTLGSCWVIIPENMQ